MQVFVFELYSCIFLLWGFWLIRASHTWKQFILDVWEFSQIFQVIFNRLFTIFALTQNMQKKSRIIWIRLHFYRILKKECGIMPVIPYVSSLCYMTTWLYVHGVIYTGILCTGWSILGMCCFNSYFILCSTFLWESPSKNSW